MEIDGTIVPSAIKRWRGRYACSHVVSRLRLRRRKHTHQNNVLNMGKNHKHVKVLKSERNKTKLKSSDKKAKDRHLPKGTNVTDTSFKVKQIVLREQLKGHASNQTLTRRHLNVKELLTRLQHYNTTVRTDALSGLKELLNFEPNSVLALNLAQVITNCTKLVLDKERSVRHEALKVVQLVFKNVGAVQITSFYPTLTSFLCCAMTHIDTNIQEDSLLLLDIYLAHAPTLIADNYDKIMANFVNLLSKLKFNSKNRTLTINLGSKISSVKWRIKVLARLQGIFRAVVGKLRAKQDGGEKNCATVHADRCSRVALCYNAHMLQMHNFSMNAPLKGADVGTVNDESSTKYIDCLVPLLFDAWLEVFPTSQRSMLDSCSADTVVSQETASTLSCILSVFLLLWDYLVLAESDSALLVFERKYNSNFNNFVLKHFPYTQQGGGEKKRQKTTLVLEVNVDPKCVKDNLMICRVYAVMNRKLPGQFHKENATRVVDYLCHCLNTRGYVSQGESSKLLLRVLKVIIDVNSVVWCKAGIKVDELLESLLRFEGCAKLSDAVADDTFRLICDVVQKPHLNKTTAFQIWLGQLPALLLKPTISIGVVNTLILLAKQSNTIFFKALFRHLAAILDNLPVIKIVGGLRDDCLPIVNIFFYMPPLFNEQKEAFNKFFVKHGDCQSVGFVKRTLEMHQERFAIY